MAAAVVAAGTLWAITVTVGGVALRAPAFAATQSPSRVELGTVTAAALTAGILAWLSLSVTERLSARPRRHWTVLASVAFVVSLGAPLSGHGVAIGDRLCLAAFHVVVAAVLIPLLGHSLKVR